MLYIILYPDVKKTNWGWGFIKDPHGINHMYSTAGV